MIKLINEDSKYALTGFKPNSVDSMVTDPPAGISFMGKEWDKDKGGKKQWIDWLSSILGKCKYSLKPGGHILVWAIPRTSHWTATAIEDAGFEIRDIINHIFGSGFPKSQGLGNGFGSAIKPATEHWILARKPVENNNITQNFKKYGTGGLNIDASRIGNEKRKSKLINGGNVYGQKNAIDCPTARAKNFKKATVPKRYTGRFPSNLIIDEFVKKQLGEYGRFFYCAKADKSERNAGLNNMPVKNVSHDGRKAHNETPHQRHSNIQSNHHPTVKSVKLMRYLVRLITPPRGVVLDPFMGCFDNKTEVLTKDGWKRFKDVNKGDKICSLNPKLKQIEFVSFSRFISYKFKGEMFWISGRSVDLLITPNHKVFAKEYHHKDFKLHTMEDFHFKNFHKCNQGVWKSKKEINMDFLRFMGFWYGDGYKVTRSRDNRGYIIGFNLKKDRKIKYLEDLIKRLPFDFKKYSKGRYTCSNRDLYSFLDGNTYSKRVPSFVFDLSSDCISAFLDGFYNADGNGGVFYSVNKGLIDDLQRLLFLSGRSGIVIEREPREITFGGRTITCKKQYELTSHKPEKFLKLTRKNISKQNYNGMVYDVTLNKNHILYVRRNGKPCWSGNSGSTGVAAVRAGFSFIGIEKQSDYFEIAKKRIEYVTPKIFNLGPIAEKLCSHTPQPS